MSRHIAAVLLLLAPAFAAADGRRVAVLVGVNDYGGTGLSDLRCAENDVTVLARLLRGDGYDDVALMTEAERRDTKDEALGPTAANVRARLTSALGGCKAGDTVLVAFAGHGVMLGSPGKLYFCPRGAVLDPKDPHIVALDEVHDALARCKASVKLLVVDACRNDPFVARAKLVEGLQSATRPRLPKPPEGTAALFSCLEGQVALESKRHPHGLFFYHLLDGLMGGARNENGRVLVEKLAAHVKETMPQSLADFPGAFQQPELTLNLKGDVEVLRGRQRFDLVAGGKKLLDAHRYADAADSLTAAIAAYPGESLRHAYRALAHFEAPRTPERLRAASEDAEEAVRLDPKSASAYAMRALAFADQGDTAKARDDANRAVQLGGATPLAYWARAFTRNYLREYGAAADDCTKALELDPSFLPAYRTRAYAYTELKSYDLAVRDLTRAIEIDTVRPGVVEALRVGAPGDRPLPTPRTRPVYYTARAYARNEGGDYSGAAADCDAALAIDPASKYAFAYRGVARLFLGEAADRAKAARDALADFQRALELNAGDADRFLSALVLNHRAVAKLKGGDYAGALADWNESVRLNANDTATYYNRGNAHVARGNQNATAKDAAATRTEYAAAEADFTQAIRCDRNQARYYKGRAAVRAALGDARGAACDREQKRCWLGRMASAPRGGAGSQGCQPLEPWPVCRPSGAIASTHRDSRG
ncbi:MAG: caspase family protein [Gemmataceae bacterium]